MQMVGVYLLSKCSVVTHMTDLFLKELFVTWRALCSIHCLWWKHLLQRLRLSYLQVQPQQRWVVSIILTTFFDLHVVSWRCLSLHCSIKVLPTSLYDPSGSPLTEKRGTFPHLHPLTSGGCWRRSCCRSAFTPESNDPAVNQGIYQLRLWLSMIRMCEFKQWQKCQHQHITASHSWGRNSIVCRFCNLGFQQLSNTNKKIRPESFSWFVVKKRQV